MMNYLDESLQMFIVYVKRFSTYNQHRVFWVRGMVELVPIPFSVVFCPDDTLTLHFASSLIHINNQRKVSFRA